MHGLEQTRSTWFTLILKLLPTVDIVYPLFQLPYHAAESSILTLLGKMVRRIGPTALHLIFTLI